MRKNARARGICAAVPTCHSCARRSPGPQPRRHDADGAPRGAGAVAVAGAGARVAQRVLRAAGRAGGAGADAGGAPGGGAGPDDGHDAGAPRWARAAGRVRAERVSSAAAAAPPRRSRRAAAAACALRGRRTSIIAIIGSGPAAWRAASICACTSGASSSSEHSLSELRACSSDSDGACAPGGTIGIMAPRAGTAARAAVPRQTSAAPEIPHARAGTNEALRFEPALKRSNASDVVFQRRRL